MKKILTDDMIKSAYENKKASCEGRNLTFELSEDYYRILMRSREKMVCFYTGKPFNLSDTNGDNYPSLDRIDPSKPYTICNTVLSTRIANSVKNDFIENGKGLGKHMTTKQINIYRSIEKVLNQPELMKERFLPYQEIQENLRQKEYEELAKEAEAFRKNEELIRQENIDKAKEKMEVQREMARHYLKMVEVMETCDIVYALSTKEHRDIFRVKRDQITGKEFESYSDKFMWITDKKSVQDTGIVTAKDFIVVHVDTQVLLDKMEQLGDTKTILGNLIKRI
tara:strand:+ start:348 stop:1190 length:843 start_codon:yes stop_codon:yes gene_type:complete